MKKNILLIICLIFSISQVALSNGGGIYCYNSYPEIVECVFSENTDYGIYIRSGKPTISNCTFFCNDSGIKGDDGIISNCTITKNTNYGLFAFSGLISNCIIWGNAQQLYDSSKPTYSCVQGGSLGVGNIDANPCFMDFDANDFHLRPESPCIDAGDPDYFPGPDEVDIDGQPRLMGLSVDMGADEIYSPAIIVTSPLKNEFWLADSIREIKWQNRVFEGDVDILLSTDAGSNWRIIDSNLFNSGTYAWHIPGDIDSDQCIIAVEPNIPDANCIVVSSGIFTVCPFYTFHVDPFAPLSPMWNKTFGGSGHDLAFSVQQTADGGYILAGDSYPFGYDFWLIKTDPNGNELWNRTFGGSGYDVASSVQQTTDGGYILAGRTESFGAGGSDFWLVKTEPNGNEQWNRTFGGSGSEYANSVQQTTDGGYILAGRTESFGAGGSDFWLVKTEPNGNEQWNRTFGGFAYDHARSVRQTTDGGYILTGYTYSFGAGNADFWLVKTDPNGNEQWNRTFGGSSDDTANSVRQTTDGGYILAGITSSFGAGDYDFWLIKTDPNGNKQWNKTFGGFAKDYAHSVQQTTDGGYILAGITSSFGAGESDFWLVKTDPNGNEQWNRTFGGSSFDYAFSIQQTTDGGYILAGGTSSFGFGASLVKFGTDGLTWDNAYNNVQDALAAASYGDEIRVAKGTYTPCSNSTMNGTLDRSSTITLKNGVALRGGYAGYRETNPDARDFRHYETILSGDLLWNDTKWLDTDNLISDPCRADNCYHVLTAFDTDSNTILDGFTITAGNANGIDSNDQGGGMYNYNSNPSLINCIFSRNSAGNLGGAMYCSNSSPAINNCTFTANAAGSDGGGMYCFNSSNPTLTNSIIWANLPDQIFGPSLVTFSCVQDLTTGMGNINFDPCFADPCNADYHLKSEFGRWDPNSSSWVTDYLTSPCIDAGDPNSDWTAELWPHGKRINMGAYGNTPQASMSPSTAGNIADFNGDGIVNGTDLDFYYNHWLFEGGLLPANLDGIGRIDYFDYAIFANEWLWQE
ncbi:MAG: right-handed parallel beta-helix repeat-containing protein [Planctomycetota bacterium]